MKAPDFPFSGIDPNNPWTWMGMLFLLGCVGSYAQSYTGVTGVRDSSYTTQTAYESTLKNHPEIAIVQPFRLETIQERYEVPYKDTYDRQLVLDVFEPTAASEGRVAVIIVHGGGWRTGNRTQHYPLAQRLADLGYVCFTPEYRLSTEALFPAAVYDLKAAVRWVRSHADTYAIDPNKIVALGFSAGGELAAFLGTTGNMPLFEGVPHDPHSSSKVNAVVDIDGTLSFVHPESGEGDDRRGTSAATYWFGYSKAEKPLLWEAASPLAYVGPKTPPTLFLNSAVDRMHAGRDDYIAVLEQHGIFHEVVVFGEAPHSFCLFHPWFEPTVAAINGFLKKVF